MTPLEHCGEVRRAVGIVSILHAGGELGRLDMANAVHTVELALLAIENALIAAGEAAPGLTGLAEIPVLTLADVAAEHKRRRPPARLRLVPTEGDAA